MTSSGGTKQRRQELYEAASAETDREKLTDVIGRVEEAMMKRLKEIAHSPNHLDERNTMVQASENLLCFFVPIKSYLQLPHFR
jgi:hypothetical protein